MQPHTDPKAWELDTAISALAAKVTPGDYARLLRECGHGYPLWHMTIEEKRRLHRRLRELVGQPEGATE